MPAHALCYGPLDLYLWATAGMYPFSRQPRLYQMLKPCLPPAASQICAIYNHYINGSTITFEEQPVSSEEMASRISAVTAGGLPWFVWEIDGAVAGYAYATPWKARSAYRFAVESTVYLDAGYVGEGIGTKLYAALISALREAGIHCVIGGIALPNAASVKLHEKLGFSKIGHFKEVGLKFGKWIDVGYWELVL